MVKSKGSKAFGEIYRPNRWEPLIRSVALGDFVALPLIGHR